MSSFGYKARASGGFTQQSPAERGKILLTLCLPDDTASTYPHAVIPYTDSYQSASDSAMRVFARYLEDKGKISLKYSIQRADGTRVWSAIEENEWPEIVDRKGEEIGVFLPGNDKAPYNPCVPMVAHPRSRIHLYSTGASRGPIVVCTNNFEEMRDCAWNAFRGEECDKEKTRIWFKIQNVYERSHVYIGNSGTLNQYLLNLPPPLSLTVFLEP